MIAKDLERELSVFSARTPTELDVIGRELRKMGFSPTGGRGTSAPDIDEQVAANFLMAAAGAPKAVSAAKAVFDFRPLLPVGGPDRSFMFAETFGEVVEFLLANPTCARSIVDMRLRRDRPAAVLRWVDGEGEPAEEAFTKDRVPLRDDRVAVWGIVPGSILEAVARKLLPC